MTTLPGPTLGVADAVTAIAGEVATRQPTTAAWIDQLVVNLSHSTGNSLDTVVALAGDDCVIHHHAIQHDEGRFGLRRSVWSPN